MKLVAIPREVEEEWEEKEEEERMAVWVTNFVWYRLKFVNWFCS